MDTKDQVGIPRFMEAVSFLDFRQKVIDGFPGERSRNYTFIIRAAAPYTIEYMDEESVRRIDNGKYGHTSMLAEKERDATNKAPSYDKREKVVIFAGGFCVNRHGKIYKWDCQSGHFNPYEKKGVKNWVAVNDATQKTLYKSAPVIADVFGFPKGIAMKCKSSSKSEMDYLNDYGDDALDDDRLFEEYDRIITDYLLSQEAQDNLKRAPWTAALTGKDLITLLLMALNVVTIMAVCCAYAGTKGYGTTNYKEVRAVDDSEMDSEEIALQQ